MLLLLHQRQVLFWQFCPLALLYNAWPLGQPWSERSALGLQLTVMGSLSLSPHPQLPGEIGFSSIEHYLYGETIYVMFFRQANMLDYHPLLINFYNRCE